MSLFLSMLALGVVSSLHCAGMCGPLVMTYAVRGEGSSFGGRLAQHSSYQSARMVSYLLVGAMLGAIGSALDLVGIRGWVMVAAGAVMVVIGISISGLVPTVRSWRVLLPSPLRRWFGGLTARLEESASRRAGRGLALPIGLGLLTGLMPCAALQVAELSAAVSGNAATGALAMLGFGLGTMPLMLGVGVASGYLSVRLKNAMLVVAAIAIVVFGTVTLDRGATLVGSPITARAMLAAAVGDTSAGGVRVGTGGVAEVQLAIVHTTYVPSIIDIPSGRAVRLVVDRRESASCSDELLVPRLGVRAALRPDGVTVVDLPPSTPGAYSMTCGMGMMSGQIRSGATRSGPNWAVIAVVGLSLAGVGLVLGVRYRLVLRD